MKIINPVISILVESQQIIENYLHLIVQLVVLPVLDRHLVAMLIIQTVFWVVIQVMNRIHLNKYIVNRIFFFFLLIIKLTKSFLNKIVYVFDNLMCESTPPTNDIIVFVYYGKELNQLNISERINKENTNQL
jgi:hypothetical protein